MKKISIVFLLFICISSVYAQRTLKGKVVDEESIGLPGVNVVLKGSLTGTITDIEGYFTLEIPENGKELIFSFIGYEDQVVPIGEKSVFNIQLKQKSEKLDEVTAIGYGSKKRKEVTGAVAKVKMSEMAENMSNTSVENILQGQVAGLSVQFTSGEPGATPVVMIRGLGTLSREDGNATSSPLWVIDGVPVLGGSDEFGGGDSNPIADIDPSDIEDISVLKDAASAAIYGSRAANGVILVTTKKGKPGRPQITFTTKAGVNFPGEFLRTIGGQKERRMKLELYDKYAPENTFLPPMLTDSLNPYWNQSTDWQNEVFDKGYYQSYNLSIKGAGDFGNYRVSMGYLDNQGTTKTSHYSRYNLGVNNTLLALNQKLRINTLLSFARVDNSRRVSDAEPSYTTSLKPAPDSPLLEGFSDRESSKNTLLNDKLRTTLDLSFIHEGLTLSSALSFTYGQENKHRYSPYLTDDVEMGSVYNFGGAYPISKNASQEQSFLLENTATYRANVKSHFFEVLLGNSVEYNQFKRVASLTNISRDFFSESMSSVPDPLSHNFSSYSAYAMLGYIGRINYKWKDRYLLNASLRVDGSSKFGEKNRWGTFPAVSGGWIFSKEKFMESLGSVLNFGKLRASWGQTGNIYGNSYLAQGLLTSYRGYLGETSVTPVFYNGYRNENLTWERSSQLDVGINLEFFKGRIDVEADYYYRMTKDLLVTIDLPLSSGYSKIPLNAADVLNKGFELAINTTNIETPKFKWETNFNIASNKNYVSRIKGGNEDIYRSSGGSSQSLIRVGKPLNNFYFLNSVGIYQSREEVPVNPLTGEKIKYAWNNNVEAGDPIYLDVNNDHYIDNKDRIIAGNPNPALIGGFNNVFYLGNFYATLYCKFTLNRDVVNKNQIKSINLGSGFASDPLPDIGKLNVWEKPGDDAFYPSINPWKRNIEWDDARYVEDGSYFKISSISFGYQFNKEVLKKYSLRRLKLYSTIENVAIFQNYSGPNAEMIPSNGIDDEGAARYPLPLSVIMGIVIGF